MTKIFWAAVLFSILAFISIVLEVGVGPRPIPVIKASLASVPEEPGHWIYRQLRHIVFKHKIILWGYEDKSRHFAALKGFLDTAAKDSTVFSVFVKLQDDNVSLPIQTIELVSTDDAARVLKPLLATGQKIIVLLPSSETSHVVKDAFVQKLERDLDTNIMSVSGLDWSPNHQKYSLVKDACPETTKLTAFPDFQVFRCLYETRTKKLVKLKTDARLGFMVDQYGQAGFLLLTYP